jgi:DNA-binding beta-propeller fold protein YncE
MEQRSSLSFGGTAAALLVGLTVGCGEAQVPTFEVDAYWPQPLDYPYILGPVSGVTVAPDGNILIVTRQDGFSAINEINSVQGTGTCCTPTQAILEYAPDGTVLSEWGGPDQGYPWPETPHGIAVDPEGNLWVGGGARAVGGGFGGGQAEPTVDTHILKFSRDGQHVATFGEVGATPSSTSMNSFGGPAIFSFDASANEAFVADGYANRRVAVLDISTGEILRTWGAYGNEPSDADLGDYDPSAPPADQFRSVTCAELSNDGLVYVCDRGNNRIQVFETDGTFVAEQTIAPATLGPGSVWDIAFSPDSGQNFLYVADGSNERVYILNRRSLEVLTTFGVGGRVPSHFMELGGVAVDQDGNVYTAENGQGRRIQKFVNTGMASAESVVEHQGAVWPAEYR